MSFKFSEISNTYAVDRYRTLLRLEEIGGTEKLQPYNDGKGLVTIGAGYNLKDPIVRSRVLEVMGITSNTTDSQTMQELNNYLADSHPTENSQIRDDLRQILGRDFEFSSVNQVYEVFNGTNGQNNGLAKIYENRVNTWANKYGLAAIPQSKERLALLSLAYNGVLAGSESLARAIKEGNRSEAWFEIRYNSNGDKLPGIAKRRYYESELFGLYSPEQLTPSDRVNEAKNIFRMFHLNRDKITVYENTYGSSINAANKDYYWPNNMQDALTQTVHDLTQSFELAKNNLIDLDLYYTLPTVDITPSEYKSTDIYIDPGRLSGGETFDPNHSAILTGSERNDIILGEGGRDRLEGNAGKDILIGGDRDDVLEGGQGDDVLVGGQGFDTYLWSPGDGNDQIIEKKEANGEVSGMIKVKKNNYDLNAAGLFEKVEGQPNAWKKTMDDGSVIRITHNSPWKLITDDGSELLLGEDFESGDFGIGLEPGQSGAYDITLTGTPERNEMGVYTHTSPQRLIFTSFPPGTTANTPFYDQPLPAAAPHMNITGGDAGDFLFGFVGHDKIDGGSGNDIIFGYMDSENGIPLNTSGSMEGDLLSGGAGDDYIQGAGAGDNISGGAGNDILSGFDGEDVMEGEAGSDVILGAAHDDILSGGDGDDLILGDGYLNYSMNLSLDTLSSMYFTFNESKPDGYYTGYMTRNFALYTDAPNGGDDILEGGAGRDYMDGGAGSDYMYGGLDADILLGDTGADYLDGGAGDDYLSGGDDADILDGGSGFDSLNGGTGDDTYVFGKGSGRDLIQEIDGADMIRFMDANSENVTITRNGHDLNIFVNGTTDGLSVAGWFDGTGPKVEQAVFGDGITWNAADLERRVSAAPGTSGNDELYGGPGGDTYFLNPNGGNDILRLDPGGNDTVMMGMEYEPSSQILVQSGLDMTIVLNDGTRLTFINWFADGCFPIEFFNFIDGTKITTEEYLNRIPMQLYGGAGNDSLSGRAANDLLYGAAGDDVMNGGPGRNHLFGGVGNDTYIFSPGSHWDYISDYYDTDIDPTAYQNDIDTVRFTGGILPADVHLTWDGSTWDGYSLTLAIGDAGDLLGMDISLGEDHGSYGEFSGRSTAGIEQLEFSDGAVWDTQDLLARLMNGTEEADSLYGADGDDILTGHGGDDRLQVFVGDNQVDGGDGNDILYGGIGSDTLMGDAGDDILYGNLGGRSGERGSAGEDNNTLTGGDGNDELYGGWGNDIMGGGTGNDMLQGGEGDDRYLFNPGDGLDVLTNGNYDPEGRVNWQNPDIICFGDGIAPGDITAGRDGKNLLLTIGSTGDCLAIRNWFGSVMSASSRAEQLEFSDGTVWGIADLADMAAGLGGPVFVGGDENDILSASGSWNDDILLGKGGDDILTGGVGCDRLDGGDGNDLLYGDTEIYDPSPLNWWNGVMDDRLDGGNGNDILYGGAGRDLLLGGIGNDTYMFNIGDGLDTIVDISTVTDRNLIAFGEGITVNDLAFTRDGTDLTIHVGSQGDGLRLKNFDRFGNTGSLVADTLQFAGGSQTSLLQLINTAPVVGMAPQNQSTTEESAYSFTIPPDTFFDTDTGDSMTYSATLGNGNPLPGWLAFDPLTCTFSGTPGNNDAGILNVAVIATDTAGATAVAGFVLNIANHIVGTAGGNNLVGTALRDVIEGLAGNDVLQGGDGNDLIIGGPGLDNLQGGPGDDIFLIEGADTAFDTFNGGAGFDTILGSDGDDVIRLHNFSGDNTVEMIDGGAGLNTVAGNDYGNLINLSGTSLLNISRIETGPGNDTVIGSAGNDLIIGGPGLDNLQGGPGDDIFLIEGTDTAFDTFNGGAGFDTILGSDGDDVIRLHNFSGDNTVEMIDGGAGLNTIAGNDYGNLINLSGTSLLNISRIETGPGNDTVIGSAGNDLIIGGPGLDNLQGGPGDDVYVFGAGDGADMISNKDTTGFDVVSFLSGIGADNVGLFRNGSRLDIGYGVTDKVSISNYFTSADYQVDQIRLSDDSFITAADINRIIQDMAAYTVAEGITLSSVNDVRNNDHLMTLIAGSWHV